MRRAARLKVAAIEDLLRQLEYAPPETRLRQMDAAERLANELDSAQNYPLSFVTYRITGYRSDTAEDSVTLVGQALMPDLVTLVHRLSQGLELAADHQGRIAMTLDQVAERLKVSTKTVQRYRKLGLVSHHIIMPDGRGTVAFFADAVEGFVERQKSRLTRAARFTRIEPNVESSIIEQARHLRSTEHLSLNQAASRLARAQGRAHETIRQMLRRHDRKAAEPIFADRGPLSPREARFAYRAWTRGLDAAELSRRLGKSKATIHRAINRKRSELLQSVAPDHIALPTFQLPDAAAIILASPVVNENLRIEEWEDGIAMIDRARNAAEIDENVEASLVAGFNLLKARAAELIAALPPWPGSREIDAIETDLRWAAMLKGRLASLAFPAALRRIEQNLKRPLTELPSDEIIARIDRAFFVISGVIETIDLGRGHRLERLTGFTMDRELAKAPPVSPKTAVITHPKHRATARHEDGGVPLRDPTGSLCRWQHWLRLRPDLKPWVGQLAEPQQAIVTSRFGLAGFPPMTIETIARKSGITSIRVARSAQEAVRRLRGMARENTG